MKETEGHLPYLTFQGGWETGVTIQHSVDVVRLLIFSYMKDKSHLIFFFQVNNRI